MNTNTNSESGDSGRTIGNGVVIGFVGGEASITALAVMTDLAVGSAVFFVAMAMLALIGADMMIQRWDMETPDDHSPGGAAARVHSDADPTED